MLSFVQYISENLNLEGKPRKVGKRIGGDIYVHKNYTKEAGIDQDALKKAQSHLPKEHQFHIVKHNPKEGSFSFIHSPDFETSHEPIAGHAVKVHPDGKLTHTKQKADPQIYHHKWEMVPDSHKGFDVAKSKERSKHWKGIVGKNREVSSRIGTKSYWDREVVPKLKESYIAEAYLAEAKGMFPEHPTGAKVEGPLNLKVKEPHSGVYKAYHKGKLVGAAATWNDLSHGKFSIYKSATHPDYRRKGVMRHIYNHIEKTTGKQLHPASALSDDGHQFWSKYRPEAVKDDLRNHRDKLMGQKINHPHHGEGTIYNVGSGVAVARKPDGMTYHVSKDLLRQHGHDVG